MMKLMKGGAIMRGRLVVLAVVVALAVPACHDAPTGLAPGEASFELLDETIRITTANAAVHGTFMVELSGVQTRVLGSEKDEGGNFIAEPANFPAKGLAQRGTCVAGLWVNPQGRPTSGSLSNPHPHCVEVLHGDPFNVVLESIDAEYRESSGGAKFLILSNEEPVDEQCDPSEEPGPVTYVGNNGKGCGSVLAWGVEEGTDIRVGHFEIDLAQFHGAPPELFNCNLLLDVDGCLNDDRIVAIYRHGLDGTGAPNEVEGVLYWGLTGVQATVVVQGTEGAPLSGVEILHSQDGDAWTAMGTTGPDGTVTGPLVPATYLLEARYGNTTAQQAGVDVTWSDHGQVIATFTATRVNLRFSGDVEYEAQGIHSSINGPTHLFPGTYQFGFSGSDQPEKWVSLAVPSGETMTRTVSYLRVRDSKGQGIAGLSARAHQEVYGFRDVPGTTDGNGVLLHIVDGVWGHDRLPGYFMIKERTGQFRGRQNPATNSFFTTFMTAELRATVVSSGGQYSVANRQVQYHVPSGLGYPYLAGWGAVGATDASGVVAKELFPGNGFGSRVSSPSVNGPNYNLTAPGVDITITIP
jgi:hypothetical protein